MLLALLALTRAGADEERSFIRFANPGFDQLSGSLDSLGDDRLVWSSPILEKPTPFFLKNVLEVTLPTTIPDFKGTHEASLRLMNGDVVKGQLVSVTDEKIIVDTWYAGRLEFRRVMVKEVDIEDRASLVFTGPTGLDGWVQTTKTPTWSYESGALRTTSAKPIGRDVKLPDDCIIAFDLAWRGSLMMQLNLFGESVDSDSPSRGYQISCQGGYATIRRFNSMMGGGDMVSVPEFKDNEKVRVEVRTSRKAGHVCLYVNGRYVAYWKDPEAGKGKFGACIQFAPMGTVQSLAISKIKISTWDAVLEDPPDGNMAMMGFGGIRRFGMGDAKPEVKEKPKDKADEAGRMKLRNGDSISGEVTKIADGVMHVKTPFAEVKLPVSRVRNIMLKPASLEEPIRRNGDVRAWFPDGSSIVFRLEGTSKETITGSSQTFGKAEFKTTAFNRLEFNIHDPKINDLRAEQGL